MQGGRKRCIGHIGRDLVGVFSCQLDKNMEA